MEMMGYLTRQNDILTQSKENNSNKNENALLQQMWQVLLEANYSNCKTTLGILKRFLYVVEGLDKQQQS